MNPLLPRASELARAAVPGRKKNHRGANLIGAKLSGAKLRGSSMRRLLIAADLSDADLRDADLIGARLRDTQPLWADLRGALFLTQPQLNAARGDGPHEGPPVLEAPVTLGGLKRVAEGCVRSGQWGQSALSSVAEDLVVLHA